MAASAVFNLASNILSTITSQAFEKAYERGISIWEARDELAKLRVTIETIQAVLLDAEKKQESSAAVKNWIKRLKDVLYDADDLFDEVATDDLLNQEMMKDNIKLPMKRKVLDSFSNKLNTILSRDSIAKQVKAIRESLLEISKDMRGFEFVSCVKEEEVPKVKVTKVLRGRQDPRCFVDPKEVIGRDEDKKALLEMLFNESDNANPNVPVVISVVGIGGMGKTTLAQLIYNDEEVKLRFEKRWLACISDTSDEKEVLGKIFQSIFPWKSYNRFEVGQLRTKIRESIDEGKKFLLVLDDVWDDDRARWQRRMSLLGGAAIGSKIIVTTRSPLVARAVGSLKTTHNLKGLSDDESWSLFKRVAFTPEQENDPRWTDLGREIVKKCRNVPLAIRSIGSLLFEKNTIQEWESIRDEKLPRLGQSPEDGIMSVLKLSYDHLRSDLKQCFAYCSLFSKDYEIVKQDLIYLWMAQGYVMQNSEDMGHSNFMDLLRRGFFQEVVEDRFGEISSCKMHDLIHDLALHVAGEESTNLASTSSNTGNCTGHVSIVGFEIDESWAIPTPLLNAKRLRSFLLMCEYSICSAATVDQLFAHFKKLRALNLSSLEIANVSSAIGELKHLRYLDLSWNKFETLPDSVTNLVNLLTLDISWCEELKALPYDFRKLINLRCLKISGCTKLEHMPGGIEKMSRLQYLDLSHNKFKELPNSITKLVNLCTLNISWCSDLEALPNDFRKLINLRHLINEGCDSLMHMPPGFKELTSLQRLDEFKVGRGTDGGQRNGLDSLSGLELKGHLQIYFEDKADDWDRVECWQPPLNLQGLEIYNYSGMRIPQWSIGHSMLPKLTHLSLTGCFGVKCLPPLRHIPNLNDLSLFEMWDLEYIQGEDEDQRKQSPKVAAGSNELFLPTDLKELILEDLPKLKGWWRKVEATTSGKDKDVAVDQDREQHSSQLLSFPSLSQLNISRCPEFNSILLCPRLRFLTIIGTVNMKVIQKLLSTRDNSSCLESVTIIQCDELVSFPGESLTSLRRLDIHECMKLKEVHLAPSHLNILKDLTLSNCPMVKISNCPELVGRCEPGRGQDWNLLSHIPKLQLPDSVPSSSALHSLDNSGSEIEVIGKGGDLISVSPEGLDRQVVDIGEVQYPNMDLSSLEELQNSGVEMVRDGDRDTSLTPPPPPPPPLPSFHQSFAPLSACRILRNDGFDSQGDTKLGDPIQETDVEKEAAGNGYSEFEKTHEDQLSDLIVPDNELGKGMLFLFGEGYEFEKEKLIQLWMAAGFIKDEPMEINGVIYFEKLMSEGYILLYDSSSLYQVNTEKVNSDLGMIQDKSKYLILESTSQHNAEPEDILHVSVVCDDINGAILKTLDKFKNLKTLLFHGSCGSRHEQVLDLFLSFKSLSILDLSGTDIKELPSSVGKMVLLQYVDLSWTLIELLPESMSRLQRLQTLKLKGCSHLRRLPRDMKMLTELRHLDFNILGQLTVMPEGLRALIKLQTLSTFLVGTQEGFNIRELRELNNLTGEFCIARLENVKSADDAEWASIPTKKCLKKLELRWSDFPLRDLKNEVADDIVLKSLRPHSDLEELQIRCYAGTNLPSWIADESFHKLARITLFYCKHVSMLPSLQRLPLLEYLELISLNSVVKLDVRGELGHVAFPKLQKLILDEMLNLESWTEAEEGDFPCLVELIIKDCPKLLELPSLLYLSSMKRLEISSCPQVRFLLDKKLSTSLEFLIVEDCPLIKESFWEQGGQEWEMMKHVPNIRIDQEAILEQTDDDSDVLGADDDNDYGIETEDDGCFEDDNGN